MEVHQLPETVVAQQVRELRHAGGECLVIGVDVAGMKVTPSSRACSASKVASSQWSFSATTACLMAMYHVGEPRWHGRRLIPPGDDEVEHRVAKDLVVPEQAAVVIVVGLAQLNEPRQHVLVYLLYPAHQRDLPFKPAVGSGLTGSSSLKPMPE